MLNEETKNWFLKVINRKTQIKHVKELKGGTASTVYKVLCTDGEPYIIKQIHNKEWIKEEKDIILKEMNNLKMLQSTKLKNVVPKLVAGDPEGEVCLFPTILMTFIEGKIESLPSNNFMKKLAESLFSIHRVNPHKAKNEYEAYRNKKEYKVPTWTKEHDIWQNLITYIQNNEQPSFEPSFIHRDYHLNNVLWKNGEIKGIIDWYSAAKGPKYIDLAHCRWNLAMTHSIEHAESFLKEYLFLNGESEIYDVYWDIQALFDIYLEEADLYSGWNALQVSQLTREEMKEKLDKYAASLHKKILI